MGEDIVSLWAETCPKYVTRRGRLSMARFRTAPTNNAINGAAIMATTFQAISIYSPIARGGT